MGARGDHALYKWSGGTDYGARIMGEQFMGEGGQLWLDRSI